MLKKIIFFIILILVCIIIYLLIFIGTHKKEVIQVKPTKTINANETWDLIQNWRTENNLKPFEKDERLCKIANTVAYYGYDEKTSFKDKYWNYPYKLAENASFGAESPQSILKDWTSSTQNLELLKKDWKYACLACHNQDCIQIYSNL